MMTSRERMLAAIRCEEPDRTPLYCWCFGFKPPPHLRWRSDGREVKHWYTMRLEHIHTLPQPWSLEDDLRRAERWLSMGVDDVLELSVPWGIHPEVKVREGKERGMRVREYDTPEGKLVHVMRELEESLGEGWVIPPNEPQLFEDFNLPLNVKHPVSSPQDLPKLRYLLYPPSSDQMELYREKVRRVREFADEREVLVQTWSAFGMDAVIWMCGAEGAVYLAYDHPESFEELLMIVYELDRIRTEIAIEVGGVDLIVERGWYSSTDFWSPEHFRRFTLPYLKRISEMVHQAGLLFGYAMTTGVMILLDELLEAGVDLLYFVDPVQDRVDMRRLKERIRGKMAVAGGVNSPLTLRHGSAQEIKDAVKEAIELLSPGGGFILSPVDALFPDTPWESVEAMIEAWRELF